MSEVKYALAASCPLDESQFSALLKLINLVYLESEKELWKENYERISAEELQELIEANELILAMDEEQPVGCVEVRNVNENIAAFSMLVADPTRRGEKIGSKLVKFAEQHALATGSKLMQLELLTPRSWSHPDKVFLLSWYSRIGYEEVRKMDLKEKHPQLVSRLQVECDFTVYQKELMA